MMEGLARAAVDDGSWRCLMGAPNLFYQAAGPEVLAADAGAAAICHGDDFPAEGNDEQFDGVGELLKQQSDVATSGRFGQGQPGRAQYLERSMG